MPRTWRGDASDPQRTFMPRGNSRRRPSRKILKAHSGEFYGLRTRSPNVEENKVLNSYVGHGTERLDVPEAILIGGMRSADERPARLRTVPAGFDPEPGRFRGINMTRAEICHWSFPCFERFACGCEYGLPKRLQIGRAPWSSFRLGRERYRQPRAAVAIAGLEL
jgi:hypothetical protein